MLIGVKDPSRPIAVLLSFDLPCRDWLNAVRRLWGEELEMQTFPCFHGRQPKSTNGRVRQMLGSGGFRQARIVKPFPDFDGDDGPAVWMQRIDQHVVLVRHDDRGDSQQRGSH